MTTPHTTGQTEMQVVPVVPTKEMLDAGYGAFMAAHDLMFCKNEPCGPIYKAMLQAAPKIDASNLTRISELEAQVKALREALRPFAAICNDDLCPDGNADDADWFRHDGYCLKNSDLRRARSLTAEGNNGSEG